jgi:hypothetical protein
LEIHDGGWHFTGACEADPNGLDRGWFVGDAAKFYKGPITVGEDGMLFSLPANSGEVIKKRLM